MALVVLPVASMRMASAAQFPVTAAPIQTWTITDGLPELPVPPVDLSECGDLDQYDEVVYGTPGNDILAADNGRQILVGLAGDDTISGGNHDDCLVGGAGDDTLDGGNGKDVLIGGAGADSLDGGTGQDRLDAGGDRGDTCTSLGAPDALIGCNAPEPTSPEVSAPTGETSHPAHADPDVQSHTPKPAAGTAESPKAPAGADAETPGAVEVAEDSPPPADTADAPKDPQAQHAPDADAAQVTTP